MIIIIYMATMTKFFEIQFQIQIAIVWPSFFTMILILANESFYLREKKKINPRKYSF